MPNYVVFDSEGKYYDVIVCEENDILPEGHTKQIILYGYKWDGTQIIKDTRVPIVVETI